MYLTNVIEHVFLNFTWLEVEHIISNGGSSHIQLFNTIQTILLFRWCSQWLQHHHHLILAMAFLCTGTWHMQRSPEGGCLVKVCLTSTFYGMSTVKKTKNNTIGLTVGYRKKYTHEKLSMQFSFTLIKHYLSRNNCTNDLILIHHFILMCQITYGVESLLSSTSEIAKKSAQF